MHASGKYFLNNGSVIVAAPTRAAAYNVGGQTIHREFKLDFSRDQNCSLSENARIALADKLSSTIAYFSMNKV